MQWIIIFFAGFAAIAPAGTGTDFPHRDWGKVATLDMTVADAAACIARELDKGGTSLVLPVDGGNDIDWSVDVAWGKHPDAWERFSIRDEAGATTLRVTYRHPSSQKRVSKHVAKLLKGCLRIKSLNPA